MERLETPYSQVLAWAARDLFPGASPQIMDSMLPIARAVRQHIGIAQHICGLEFHHDSSGRVDLSLACLSELCDFNRVSLPVWWPAYLDSCDSLEHGYALAGGPFVDSSNASLSQQLSRPVDEVIRPSAHCLEFDSSSEGLTLAGLFQGLCAPEIDPSPKAWWSLLRALPIEISPDCLELQPRQGVLDLVRDELGWPHWAGLMCGRKNLLKLVYEFNLRRRDRLFNVLERAHCDPTIAEMLLASEGFDELAWMPPSGCQSPPNHSCLSLNLNLAANALVPSVAIEYYPSRRSDETLHWTLLGALREAFPIAESELNQAKDLLGCLPVGVKSRRNSNSILALLPGIAWSGSMGARLSHYKVTLGAGGQCNLKSYVSLAALTSEP